MTQSDTPAGCGIEIDPTGGPAAFGKLLLGLDQFCEMVNDLDHGFACKIGRRRLDAICPSFTLSLHERGISITTYFTFWQDGRAKCGPTQTTWAAEVNEILRCLNYWQSLPVQETITHTFTPIDPRLLAKHKAV